MTGVLFQKAPLWRLGLTPRKQYSQTHLSLQCIFILALHHWKISPQSWIFHPDPFGMHWIEVLNRSSSSEKDKPRVKLTSPCKTLYSYSYQSFKHKATMQSHWMCPQNPWTSSWHWSCVHSPKVLNIKSAPICTLPQLFFYYRKYIQVKMHWLTRFVCLSAFDINTVFIWT